MASLPVVSLPLPLLLLVHLYILDYPNANDPEYGPDLFNPRVRGLRDRTRSMEDIFYFLVGCLEGGKPGAKTILPTYPCSQPSDTVAFRTSLSKYLESLRHGSLYGSASRSSSSALGSNWQGKESTVAAAWWWRDVVVRKTLLEECSGEKFERLLIAVSTHVLFRRSDTLPLASAAGVLQSQPVAYARALYRSRLAQREWALRASLLSQRLASVEEAKMQVPGPSRFADTPTERLLAIAESAKTHLIENYWGSDGSASLQRLISAVGLGSISPKPADSEPSSNEDSSLSKKNTVILSDPLPVAAAHHPSRLRKVKASPQNLTKGQPNLEAKSSGSFNSQIWGDALDLELALNQSLKSARVSVKALNEKLKSRWGTSSGRTQSIVAASTLWRPAIEEDAVCDLPVVQAEEVYDYDYDYDYRIDQIREEMLPLYPARPNQSKERLPAIESKIERSSPHATATRNEDSARKSNLPPQPLYDIGNSTRPSRFSIARTRQTSTLVASNSMDEVDQMVDGVYDSSTESPHLTARMNASSLQSQTPKKRAAPNRIWTSGTPKPVSTVRKGRESFPMESLLEPAISLPSLSSRTSNLFDQEMISGILDADESMFDTAWDGSPFKAAGLRRGGDNRSKGDRGGFGILGEGGDDIQKEELEDRDEWLSGGEGPSVTLRDILLQTDISQFDLLSIEDGDSLDHGMLLSEQSVIWE